MIPLAPSLGLLGKCRPALCPAHNGTCMTNRTTPPPITTTPGKFCTVLPEFNDRVILNGGGFKTNYVSP